jgi:hypothetical protein
VYETTGFVVSWTDSVPGVQPAPAPAPAPDELDVTAGEDE